MTQCSYKLRVDLNDVSLDSVLNAVKDSDAYAYVMEGLHTENPHTHMFLKTQVKEKTLRARLRKLGLKGNKSYSLKELEDEYPIEYLAYMMKEKTPVWNNIPDDVKEQANAHQDKVVTEIKKKKESRKTHRQILEQKHINNLNENGLLPCSTGGERYPTKDYFMNLVIETYKEEEWLIRDFQIIAEIKTLCMKYVPSYDYEYKKSISDKI